MNLKTIKDNLAVIVSVIQLIILLVVGSNKIQKLEDGQAVLQAQYLEIKQELKHLSSLDRRVAVLEVRVDLLGAKK